MALQIVARKRRKSEGEAYIYPAYGSAPAKFQVSVKTVGKPRSETFALRAPKSMGMDCLIPRRSAVLEHIAGPESTMDTLSALVESLRAELKAEGKLNRGA